MLFESIIVLEMFWIQFNFALLFTAVAHRVFYISFVFDTIQSVTDVQTTNTGG